MSALIAAALAVLPLPAFAQDMPSPTEREMSTDRPDKTESPYSVPKGRVQIEMNLANYTRDRSADGRVETIGVAPFNLKLASATTPTFKSWRRPTPIGPRPTRGMARARRPKRSAT